MVSFGVDDVRPAAELLPTPSLGLLFPDALVVCGEPGLSPRRCAALAPAVA